MVDASASLQLRHRESLIYGRFLEERDAENLEHCVEVQPQLESLPGNRDQQVTADGRPHLGLDRVFRRAVESLDAQVLFDPLEEQLDLPPAPVQVGDHVGGLREVVGQEHQALVRLRVAIANPPQVAGIPRDE